MNQGRPLGSKKSNRKVARNITISAANDAWLKTTAINLSAKVDEMVTAMRWEAQRISAVIVDSNGIHEVSGNGTEFEAERIRPDGMTEIVTIRLPDDSEP